MSQEKKDDALLNLNFNKAQGLFVEKTLLNSSTLSTTKEKYSYWSAVNENNEQLSVGYLFDMLQYLCIAT